METTVIRLTIFRQAERYIFSLELPCPSALGTQEQVVRSVGGITAEPPDIRSQLDEAVERLQRDASSHHMRSSDACASLRDFGQYLFNLLLPPAVQDALRDGIPQNQPLPIILTTNDTELPWELLHDGNEFLALKHPFARRLWSTAPLRFLPHDLRPQKRSFLFIANPTEDLAEADDESDDIIDLFEPLFATGTDLKLLARARADKLKVSQELARPYDLIHYSGHAEPGALRLHDDKLTTEQIERALQGSPFVFLNACSSSREVKSADSSLLTGESVRSLAEAFLLGGAKGFIGTLFKIFDESSREFAKSFYTQVLTGVSVGEALRRTRQQMREELPHDPLWASFVFYGDPMLTLAKARPEKRYVTVLIARLMGVESLFNSLPLEAAVEIQNGAFDLLRQVSERYHGQYHGPLAETFGVYFGVEGQHGNEAEVAIRAAREMIDAVDAWPQQRARRVTLRVGISTGHVLWSRPGNQIGGNLETLAAAASTQANSGQIVVDQATYESARTTIRASRIADSRFYNVIGHKLLPTERSQFVGREEELAQLHSLWRKARRGRRQVICIVGEAGVGKSRLLEAFREQITPSPLTPNPSPLTPLPQGEGDYLWISASCHSYDKSQSYHLLGQVIRALAQIEPHDDYATQGRKLRQLVEGEDDYALLSTVLGLPFEMPAIQNLSQELAQKLLKKLLERILKRQAASQPIVLVLEDLQSADEDSLTVLEKLVKGRSNGMALLLLAVYRLNEWEHNWGDRVQANILLDELPSDAQLTMLTNLLDFSPSEELTQILLNQTGGNPLFIEEYIRFLQESNLLTRSGQTWTTNPSSLGRDLSDIPLLNKVEAVIQARLGRLDDQSRQTLHSAAIIGYRFEDQVLYKVRESSPDKFDQEEIIEELSYQRLIEELEEGHLNILFYTFRHGLVHQIASQLFPESFLQTIHRLVAQALLWVYQDEEHILYPKGTLYRLAHHYYHSRDRTGAIRYCLRAAKSDAQKWANQGAILWYERALEKIQSFEGGGATAREETEGATPTQLIQWHVEALEKQADVRAIMGHTDLAIEGYAQALALCTASDGFSVTHLAALYHKMAIIYHDKAQYDLAQQAVDKGLEALAGMSCLEAGRLHVYTGVILWKRARFADGYASCTQGIAMIEASSTTEGIRDLAQAYNLRGIFCRRLEESQQAIISYEQSIALYEQAEYIPGLERASYNLACIHKDLGKWEAALASFQQSSSLSERTGEVQRQATALNGQGEIYLRLGKLEQAIEAYEQARHIFKEYGLELFLGVALMNLGATYLKKKQLTLARSNLSESLEIFDRLGANQYLPELLRYLAELEVLSDEPLKGLRLAQEAIDLAEAQGNKQEEGQAKRTLGQAYRALGQHKDANQQLEESLAILEKRNMPHEVGLTLVELALLRKAQAEDSEDNSTLIPSAGSGQASQGLAYLQRAKAIFDELGAALDYKRAAAISF